MSDESNVIGSLIGSYRIIAEIGSGAFGNLYKAKHIIFEERPIVAIKLLHANLKSPKERTQFIQEARLLNMLHHPYTLPIIDAGLQDSLPYIIMEYASQGSLQDRLDRLHGHPLPTMEAITILKQIGQALYYAHQQNIVHRDIKPSNILFNAKGDALLADFGIATVLATASTNEIGRAGTPAYMAPEQFEGKVSRRSDQYALGCVAYEIFTGRKPFDVENAGIEAVWYQHAKVNPDALSQINPQLPLYIEQAVLKAMAKDRHARYTDVLAFISALQQNAEEEPSPFEGKIHQTDENGKGKSDDNVSPPNISNNNPTIAASYPPNTFLIKHHEADLIWAEWVVWQLEEKGYTVILPDWDFPVGSKIRNEMQKAEADATFIIDLLSSNYFNNRRGQYFNNRRGQSMLSLSKTSKQTIVVEQRERIPIRIDECDLKRTKYKSTKVIDLAGQDEPTARRTLLAGIRKERGKPEKRPNFPVHHVLNEQPRFPLSQSDPGVISVSQLESKIEIAFTKKDWPDVIRKARFLIKQIPLSISPEIYRMLAVALLEEGETEPACEAFETSLSHATDNKTRLSLLKGYAETLASLKQWSKVLSLTNEALRLAPNDPYWLASRQETLAKMSPPMQPKQQIIEIFFSYSHEDKEMLKNLDKFLDDLKKQVPLITWHDGEIKPGQKWLEEINMHLDSADIILLLISQAFIASDFCYKVEMTKALERHEAGKAHVIPIILSPSTWKTSRIKDLQALPTDGKPIVLWRNKELAYLNVFNGIQKIVDSLKSNK